MRNESKEEKRKETNKGGTIGANTNKRYENKWKKNTN